MYTMSEPKPNFFSFVTGAFRRSNVNTPSKSGGHVATQDLAGEGVPGAGTTLFNGEQAFVIAVINNKGGVGKTTTAVNLAAALASKEKVLFVDLDRQASGTIYLGFHEVDHPRGTMLGIFQEGIPIQQVIRDSGIENLDFIPSGNGLTYIEERLGAMSIYALKNALQKIAYDYKYIILDCPPTFNSLSKNILIAADGCIIPVTPQFLAMKGLENMVSSIDSLDIPGENVAPLLGIALTMVDYTNQYAYAKSKEIQIQYAKYAFETVIPFESSLQESTEVGKSIFDFSARSRSALSYWRLSKEVVERADRLRLETRIRQYTPNRIGARPTR